ncbi:hypothetical protein IAR50_002367 [Cryptococcus sp. DSM 104548]
MKSSYKKGDYENIRQEDIAETPLDGEDAVPPEHIRAPHDHRIVTKAGSQRKLDSALTTEAWDVMDNTVMFRLDEKLEENLVESSKALRPLSPPPGFDISLVRSQYRQQLFNGGNTFSYWTETGRATMASDPVTFASYQEEVRAPGMDPLPGH